MQDGGHDRDADVDVDRVGKVYVVGTTAAVRCEVALTALGLLSILGALGAKMMIR